MKDPRNNEMPTVISTTVDLCWSDDEDVYYFQRFPEKGEEVDWTTFKDTSQEFSTLDEARAAYPAGLRWVR